MLICVRVNSMVHFTRAVPNVSSHPLQSTEKKLSYKLIWKSINNKFSSQLMNFLNLWTYFPVPVEVRISAHNKLPMQLFFLSTEYVVITWLNHFSELDGGFDWWTLSKCTCLKFWLSEFWNFSNQKFTISAFLSH